MIAFSQILLAIMFLLWGYDTSLKSRTAIFMSRLFLLYGVFMLLIVGSGIFLDGQKAMHEAQRKQEIPRP